MRLAPCAAVLATSLGLACAAPSKFVCPARGGPTWRELRSDNFLLRSDLPRDAAVGVLDQLELLRAALLKGMFDRPVASPERLEVLAFASHGEFVELTGRADLAGFFARSDFGRQRILLAGDLGSIQSVVVAHELAHLLSYHYVGRQPRWFAEGLATYFQTVGEGAGARRRAGSIPRGPWLAPLARGPLPVRAVLGWRRAAEEPAFYASSWLLVHYLMNQQPEAFMEFQRRLARLENPRLAWDAAFPEWSIELPSGPEKLDPLLRAYLRSTDWEFHEVEAQPVTTVTERILSPAEVHAARLEAARDLGRKRSRAEVDEALAEDPGLVAALSAAAALDPVRAPAHARAAVGAHPEQAAAWTLLGTANRGPDAAGREAAHRRAVQLSPERAELRYALALDLLAAGRAEEADAEARRAIRAAPWSPVAHWVQSSSRLALGRCRESLEDLAQAADLLAERASTDESCRNAKELEKVQARCGDPAQRAAGVLVLRGSLALQRRDEAAAVALLQRAVEADPRQPEAFGLLGEAQLLLGHAAEAVRSLERQAELHPADPDALGDLARALRALHRSDEAEAAYRRGLEKAPEEAPLRASLAWLLLEQARPAEALAELQRLAPGEADPHAHLLRGRAHLLLGDRGNGVRELERAAQLSGDPGLLDGGARALAMTGLEPKRAAEWSSRARAELTADVAATQLELFGPDQADATRRLLHSWVTEGWILLRAGELAGAERALSAAERLGGDPQASAGLAEALEQAGRPEEAARARARALLADPSLARSGRWARGATEAARGLTAAAGPELERLRSLPLEDGMEGAGRDLLLALGADGKVAAVLARDGAPLPLPLAALRGQAHGIALPVGAPPLLVLPGAVECRSGACAVRLGHEPPAAAPQAASAPSDRLELAARGR
jgi:tetratricopeptide (TPR) repeat protein